MAVTVCEMAGSPTGGYDGNNLSRKRKVRVAWDDITAYEQELLPVSSVSGNQNSPGVGASYPGFPGLRVTGFSWAPLAGDNSKTDDEDIYGVMAYEYAVFDITYGVPKADTGSENQENGNPPDYDPVQLLTHSFDAGGEYLTLPNTKFYWNGTGSGTAFTKRYLSEDAKVGIFVPTVQHSLSWPKVIRPNWDALLSNAGTVNNASFKLRGFSYPIGTLLYLGFSGEQEVMSDGVRAWKMGLKFSVRYIKANVSSDSYQSGYAGWNDFFDEAGDGLWRHAKRDDTDAPAFGLTAFDDLFAVGA